MTDKSFIHQRGLLIAGFLAVSLGTAIAYRSPATGYELSIYAGTPTLFWIGIGIALFVSLLTILPSYQSKLRKVGVALGALSMFSIVSLPIIRGYFWVGGGDALSHLGYAKDIQAGILEPTNLRYPAVHTIGGILGNVAGIEIRHALLILTPLFVLTFFIFTPLAIYHLTNNRFFGSIGAVSAFLLLPINHFSGHIQIHPTSQAVMFAPAILYLFIRMYKKPAWNQVVLFVIVSTFFILLHPQQAANYVLFFGVLIGTQFIYRITNNRPSVISKKSSYGVLLAFVGFWWVWVANLAIFESALSSVITRIFAETTAAESVQTRAISLNILGGSIEEIFFKLFFVAFIYCIFAGFLMLLAILKGANIPKFDATQTAMLSGNQHERELLLFITVGFVAVSVIFFVYVITGYTDQYFRHYAFMMGIVTVVGAISIGRSISAISDRLSSTTVTRCLVLVFAIFLLLSIPVVHSGPFIYQDSDHVTKSSFEGYATHFDNHGDLPYLSVRSSPGRFSHGVISRTAGPETPSIDLPDHFADRELPAHVDENSYIVISERDRIRDADLYQGFRFSHEDFEYLENELGIEKVQSNEGFDLYLVTPANDNIN